MGVSSLNIYENKENITMSLAVWLAHSTYDHADDPTIISATTLLNPLRAIVLARQNKDLVKIADVESYIPSRMGTAYHTAIESAWRSPKLVETIQSLGFSKKIANKVRINPSADELSDDIIPVYMEIRSYKEFCGFKVSGKFDFVANARVEDFKSTSTYAWIFGSNDVKYSQQGSIYRVLNQDIIKDDVMKIHYIFTDWQKSKTLQDKDYPPKRIMSQDIELMSIKDTETFITNILTNVNKLMGASQEQLPECTPEELWQKADKWKYYKDPNKTSRSTKNFDNATEAHDRHKKDGGVGKVVHIPGEVVKCRYCDVSAICDQAQTFVRQGLLVI